MGKVGRPVIEINEEQLEKLASFHCSWAEMAAFFDCSKDTLRNNYSAIIEKGREKGKLRLRKAQIETALKGNATLLIFLGKQYLDQSDKVDNKITTTQELDRASIERIKAALKETGD